MIKYIDAEVDLTNKQLILPSVGFGSAPSLALDMLIATNGFKRVAFVHSHHLEPSVGYLNKAIENGALGLPAELYVKGEVAILQLRSRPRVGRAREFVEQIRQIFQKCLDNGVIVLGALPFSMRSDLEIGSLSRNTYCYTVGDMPQFAKCVEAQQFRPISDLIDQDEEPIEVLENAGLIKPILKNGKFGKLACLCVFSEEMTDRFAAGSLGKSLVQGLGSNEVGQCEAKALE